MRHNKKAALVTQAAKKITPYPKFSIRGIIKTALFWSALVGVLSAPVAERFIRTGGLIHV